MDTRQRQRLDRSGERPDHRGLGKRRSFERIFRIQVRLGGATGTSPRPSTTKVSGHSEGRQGDRGKRRSGGPCLESARCSRTRSTPGAGPSWDSVLGRRAPRRATSYGRPRRSLRVVEVELPAIHIVDDETWSLVRSQQRGSPGAYATRVRLCLRPRRRSEHRPEGLPSLDPHSLRHLRRPDGHREDAKASLPM